MKLENKITAELMQQKRIPLGANEVKKTNGSSIPFSAFADHQIAALLKVKKHGLIYKIADVGIARKPFDLVHLKGFAWCVCCYPANNKDGYNCYAIDIDEWYTERRTSERKSLTELRAKELGHLL